MHVSLVNPPLVGFVDKYLSGLPHQPVGLLSLAAVLRDTGVAVDVIDCFTEDPGALSMWEGGLAMRGMWGERLLARLDPATDLVGISCATGLHHRAIVRLIPELKRRVGKPVVLGGDHATVRFLELIAAGADFVIRGEGERALPALLDALHRPDEQRRIPGLAGRGFVGPEPEIIADIDSLPFPAFDLIDIEAYWRLRDSHGPFAGPYLDIFTSRGCPYACDFCAGPAICKRRWRGRSPELVVAEMEGLHRDLGVMDFQIQDPSFSVNRARVRSIARLLIERRLPISYCLPTGIHPEHLELEDLDLMKESGLRYFSVAPESGSARVRKLMNKSVDIPRLEAFVERAHRLGIRTSASFVIGYPGEEDGDREETRALALELMRLGLDEFPVFIFFPIPGSAAEKALSLPNYESITSSPTWRADYAYLAGFRRRLLIAGMLAKLASHPDEALRNAANIVRGRFEIKAEMVVRRAIRQEWRNAAYRLRRGAARLRRVVWG